MSELSREVAITNKRGLHARASARFVATAAQMNGVTITVSKDGISAGGNSILGLMMLGAAMGDTIVIHVDGDGAEAALQQLVALVEERFGEE